MRAPFEVAEHKGQREPVLSAIHYTALLGHIVIRFRIAHLCILSQIQCYYSFCSAVEYTEPFMCSDSFVCSVGMSFITSMCVFR